MSIIGNDFSRGHGAVLNYKFDVMVGFTTIHFSKISNISSEREIETYGEGGKNDQINFFLKPKREPETLILEQGIISGSISDTILTLMTEGLIVNNIFIYVKRGDSIEKIFWIEKAIISKRSFSNLDALGHDLFIKKFELKHFGVLELDV